MSELEQPIRSEPFVHLCACRLTYPGSRPVDECRGVAANPDSPLCQDCINSGHDDLPHVPYVEVVAARQQEEAS